MLGEIPDTFEIRTVGKRSDWLELAKAAYDFVKRGN